MTIRNPIRFANNCFPSLLDHVYINISSKNTSSGVILDRHVPLRPMSKKEQRLSNKPWITPEIFNSIKTKKKIFQNYFKSNNPDKNKFFKK